MPASRLNRPLWLEAAETRFPSLTSTLDVDVAVIGAGITGVTTAYLLKQAEKTVALIESTGRRLTARPATRPRSSRSATASSTTT